MGNISKWGLVLLWLCAAGACGEADSSAGGSRSGGLAEDVVPPAFCDEVSDWDPEALALEEEMLRLINLHRTEGSTCGGPTHALQSAPALRCAARLHSKDMDERDFYQHVNPDGDDPRQRMEAVGFTEGPWAENIVKGPRSAEKAMEGFMESPAHCSNIMSPELGVVGIGVHGTTWTQAFSD
jgi:uncharacterized protein YkwD